MRNILFLLWLSILPSFGELSPSVYKEKQLLAPEHLQLYVLDVTTFSDFSVTPVTQVRAVAIVTQVKRTTSQLKPGDILEILYSVTLHPKGWCGPGEVPLMKTEEETVAYLSQPSGKDFYVPAAGVMSFRDF